MLKTGPGRNTLKKQSFRTQCIAKPFVHGTISGPNEEAAAGNAAHIVRDLKVRIILYMKKMSTTLASRGMLIFSMLIFGSVGIVRKMIPLSSAVLAGYRGVAGALFLMLFLLIRGEQIWRPIGKKKVLGLVLAGAGIGINWMLLFEAYNYTTVATATLCYYMQPIIVTLLSPLLFHEKLTGRKIVCVLAALVGMVFVSGLMDQKQNASNDLQGILLGLGAALFYAAVVITNKKLTGVDAYQKTTVELGCAAITVLPYILLVEKPGEIHLDLTAVIMLAVIGLVHTGAAYVMYFSSIDRLPIQSVAIIGYLDPITAMLFSVILLAESISLSGVIGAVLILGATAVSELGSGRKA